MWLPPPLTPPTPEERSALTPSPTPVGEGKGCYCVPRSGCHCELSDARRSYPPRRRMLPLIAWNRFPARLRRGVAISYPHPHPVPADCKHEHPSDSLASNPLSHHWAPGLARAVASVARRAQHGYPSPCYVARAILGPHPCRTQADRKPVWARPARAVWASEGWRSCVAQAG